MRLALAALLLGGCFTSNPAAGLLCGHHDECPSGMTCDRNAFAPTCRPDGSDAGAATAPDFGSAGPPALVTLPAGSFEMGCNSAVRADCAADEGPARMVSLPAFSITRDEITNAEYAACVDDHAACSSPLGLDREQPTLPVDGLFWAQAQTYCGWARMRLPTEAEWEYAARGGSSRTYPWGESPDPDCDHASMSACPSPAALAVGSKPDGRTPEGLDDMAGNVAEWVYDFYTDRYDPHDLADPRGPSTGTQRVIRGGSYQSDAMALRMHRRDQADPQDERASVGFRCARSTP